MNLSNRVRVSLTGGMGESWAAKCSFHHPLGPSDLSLSTTNSKLPTAIRICIKPNKRCFSAWGHMAAPTVGVLIRQIYMCTPQPVQCNTCHLKGSHWPLCSAWVRDFSFSIHQRCSKVQSGQHYQIQTKAVYRADHVNHMTIRDDFLQTHLK